jgi:ubiquinone/menaquinone biosynthesis C-methylase UbiE
MSDFDAHAREWDNNKMHIDRSEAIAAELIKDLPDNRSLKALEYGAGTGLLSFVLRDRFSEIVLMDNSIEMIKVCLEKKEYFGTDHVRPIFFDLENSAFDEKFDVIYNQMVFHHVNNIDTILSRFHSMLKPGGILFIADLFPEDGSFHGSEVKVHHGFDPVLLIEKLKNAGFYNGEYKTCFTITRPNGIDYPVFLLTTHRK